MVQIMAWRRPGDKPLSESMMVSLPTHTCVAQPQWINCPSTFRNFKNMDRLLLTILVWIRVNGNVYICSGQLMWDSRAHLPIDISIVIPNKLKLRFVLTSIPAMWPLQYSHMTLIFLVSGDTGSIQTKHLKMVQNSGIEHQRDIRLIWIPCW